MLPIGPLFEVHASESECRLHLEQATQLGVAHSMLLFGMRYLLKQVVPYEPPVRHVYLDFPDRLPHAPDISIIPYRGGIIAFVYRLKGEVVFPPRLFSSPYLTQYDYPISA